MYLVTFQHWIKHTFNEKVLADCTDILCASSTELNYCRPVLNKSEVWRCELKFKVNICSPRVLRPNTAPSDMPCVIQEEVYYSSNSCTSPFISLQYALHQRQVCHHIFISNGSMQQQQNWTTTEFWLQHFEFLFIYLFFLTLSHAWFVSYTDLMASGDFHSQNGWQIFLLQS